VMLIDDRFAEPRIQQLLPRWWSLNAGENVPISAG